MNWTSIKERVVAGLILLIILGVVYLIKSEIDRKNEQVSGQEMIDFYNEIKDRQKQ